MTTATKLPDSPHVMHRWQLTGVFISDNEPAVFSRVVLGNICRCEFFLCCHGCEGGDTVGVILCSSKLNAAGVGRRRQCMTSCVAWQEESGERRMRYESDGESNQQDLDAFSSPLQ
eukprot:scaffold4438_cov108-Skeletonema_marinoi.AAC.3